MENWARSLSQKAALTIGNFTLLIGIVCCSVLHINMSGGMIFTIILGALLGATVGFSYSLIYKGITGYTPQEKRELS